jgi:hypothetical protein
VEKRLDCFAGSALRSSGSDDEGAVDEELKLFGNEERV